MEELEDIGYIKTEEEINTIIQEYEPENDDTCRWCESTDVDHPFRGFRRCHVCGRHSLFNKRFHWLEVDKHSMFKEISGQTFDMREEITLPKVKEMNDLVNKEYDERNKQPGSHYYRDVLILNNLSSKEKVEKL